MDPSCVMSKKKAKTLALSCLETLANTAIRSFQFVILHELLNMLLQ